MCYFNRYIRSSYYEHNINNKYVDHCYDCSMLVNLLTNYKNIKIIILQKIILQI